MTTLSITLLITVILSLYYELCSCRCAHAEYEIDEQCCPMCAPGNYVFWACADDTSTTCAPCPESTFTDKPNSFPECLTCTECDSSTGSTDTVCADCKADTYSNGSLSSCKPHTKCEALGLTEINPGTQSSDSECGNLPNVTAIAVSVTLTVIIIITIISVLTIRHILKKK